MLRVSTERRRFDVPEFGNAKHRWTSRESMLVRLQAEGAATPGMGEASPLPGFSKDTMDEVASSLEALVLEMPRAVDPRSIWNELARAWNAVPESGRFALEVALVDLLCRTRRSTLEGLLSELFLEPSHCRGWHGTAQNVLPPLGHAALVALAGDDFLGQVRRLSDQGFQVYKVKVGADLDRETRVMFQWNERFRDEGRPLRLRLDANQTLKRAEVSPLFEAWRRLPVEFVEEPCPPLDLRSLESEALALPIAFDESLVQAPETVLCWLNEGKVGALVCKPMFLGGLQAVDYWYAHAARRSIPLVLSHLFDGLIANRVYHALARVLAPAVVAGLGPHPGLELWSRELAPNSSEFGLGLERRGGCGGRSD